MVPECVSLSIVYSHVQNNAHAKVLSSLEFRLKVIDGLLQRYARNGGAQMEEPGPANPPPPPVQQNLHREMGFMVLDNMRLTGRHFLEMIPGNAKPDCIVCSDRATKHRKQTTLRCKQCLKAMCAAPCFERYHTLKDYKVKY